jgi:hypothetical protein
MGVYDQNGDPKASDDLTELRMSGYRLAGRFSGFGEEADVFYR